MALRMWASKQKCADGRFWLQVRRSPLLSDGPIASRDVPPPPPAPPTFHCYAVRHPARAESSCTIKNQYNFWRCKVQYWAFLRHSAFRSLLAGFSELGFFDNWISQFKMQLQCISRYLKEAFRRSYATLTYQNQLSLVYACILESPHLCQNLKESSKLSSLSSEPLWSSVYTCGPESLANFPIGPR